MDNSEASTMIVQLYSQLSGDRPWLADQPGLVASTKHNPAMWHDFKYDEFS